MSKVLIQSPPNLHQAVMALQLQAKLLSSCLLQVLEVRQPWANT
jgi:hypothetical protein